MNRVQNEIWKEKCYMNSKVHTFKFMLTDVIIKITIKFQMDYRSLLNFKSNNNFYCRHVTSKSMH
jgi:hypothetical protein